MPLEIEKFDVFVLDGFGTLYDKNLSPLTDAERFLGSVAEKSILFSNVGSMTGSQLKNRLKSTFYVLPAKVQTSMDLLLRHLKRECISSVYHYGGEAAARTLSDSSVEVVPHKEDADVLVFTSLPGNDWIQESQFVLNLIYSRKVKSIILANPDRLLPGEHVGINVGMMFDMLTKSWPRSAYPLNVVEIGKPLINREDLGIAEGARVLVVGDNRITDGGLAERIGADFALISARKFTDSGRLNIYRSFGSLVNGE